MTSAKKSKASSGSEHDKEEDPSCLYGILQLSSSASQDEVTKQYRKLALKHHPDRHAGKDAEIQNENLEKFKCIGRAYSILSDPAKRKRYDQTGQVDDREGILADGGEDADAFFRDLYDSCVTPETIEAFKKEYQGSEEEKKDVLNAYEKYQGNLDAILEEIPCSSIIDDEARFTELIQKSIAAKEIVAYDQFTKETPSMKKKRRRAAEREAAEAEALAKELGIGRPKPGLKADGDEDNEGDASLKQLIMKNATKRKDGFDSFLSNLEAKYGGNPSDAPHAKSERSKKRKKDRGVDTSSSSSKKKKRKGHR